MHLHYFSLIYLEQHSTGNDRTLHTDQPHESKDKSCPQEQANLQALFIFVIKLNKPQKRILVLPCTSLHHGVHLLQLYLTISKPTGLTENVYWSQSAIFSELYSRLCKTYVSLYVKCSLQLSDFNQNCTVNTLQSNSPI
jgi:hypothetical protein